MAQDFIITNVPAFYRGALHQEKALLYLWSCLSDGEKTRFIELWRKQPDPLPYRPSRDCLELIKHFEGLKLKAYKCPANVWTIGWGHTQGAHPGQIISLQEAEALLLRDLAPMADYLCQWRPANATQNQFDAMLSFLFNLGITQFNQSSAASAWRRSKFEEVPNLMMRWIRGGGKILPGLVRRRKVEGHLFVSGTLEFNPGEQLS